MSARPWKRSATLGTAALFGALAALSLSARARSTMAAEVALSLGRRPAWLQASWADHTDGLQPAVARVLTQAPEDVELQIAAATLPPGPVDREVPDLERLAQRFPW